MDLQDVNAYRAMFPSTFSSVAQARRAVRAFAESCAFQPSDVSDIVLAVGEACSNAAEHGHVESGHFTVGCVLHRGVFRAEVRDRGRGFDTRALATSSDDPLLAFGRGRGITIMRALMDRVRYASSPAGTTVVLEKRVPPPSRQSDSPASGARLPGRSRKAAGEIGGLDAGHRR